MGKVVYVKITDVNLGSMLRSAQAGMRDIFDQALTGEAELIMREARRRVPLDLGTLRASGVILPVERSASTTIVKFGFGGSASAYAYIQHAPRVPPFHHKPGRTELYLYNPVEERMPFIERSIAQRAGRLLRAKGFQ